MNLLSLTSLRTAGVATLALAATAAQAHTGHATTSLFEGLSHPFGLDHLLAMVAVGVWSVRALPAHQTWRGPVTFLLALVASAALGAAGVSVPFLEQLIALSVVLFGLMLVCANQPLPTAWGLTLVAVAASLHGLAHGAETPPAGFASYAIGFGVTTAALHAAGVWSARGLLARRASWAISLGALFSGAGLVLLSQV